MGIKKFLLNVNKALEIFLQYYEDDRQEQAFVQIGIIMADIRKYACDIDGDDECEDCDCGNNEEETQEDIDKYFSHGNENIKLMKECIDKLESLKKSIGR